MLPFIKKLTDIYVKKKRILQDLEKLSGDVGIILKDPAWSYTDEEHIVFEGHGHSAIAMLNELVAANVELQHYDDKGDSTSLRDNEGINVEANILSLNDYTDILNAYKAMMQQVEKEQRLLTIHLKPGIGEMMQSKDWHLWRDHLRYFRAFIEGFKIDIAFFLRLLEILLAKGYLEDLRRRNHETAEERDKRIRDELRPPARSFQPEELFITADKKDWKLVGPGNIGYALPFPEQNPKSYYIVPRISPNNFTPIHNAFTKIYSGIKEGEDWHTYVIERAAWASATVMNQHEFDLRKFWPTWEAEGEKGVARKRETRPPTPPIQPQQFVPPTSPDFQHRFLVRGTYYHGKPVRGTQIDFRDLPMDGESMDDYIVNFNHWVLGFWNFSPKAMLYNPEGKDYIYGFKNSWGTVDAGGRRGSETLTLKTTKEMNFYEYLLTLQGLQIGIAEKFNPARQPEYAIKPQEPLKLYAIGPSDRRYTFDRQGSERNSAYIIHVGPGKQVYSTPEIRQKVQEEISKNANLNEIIATLIHGENAFVGPEGLAAISRVTEMLPHIRWMGILNIPKEGSISFDEISRRTTEIKQPGVFDAGERLLRRRTSQCNEFVNKVMEKFGSNYAKFHVMYETVSDPEKRRLIVELYVTGQIDRLKSELSESRPWLQAIGARI